MQLSTSPAPPIGSSVNDGTAIPSPTRTHRVLIVVGTVLAALAIVTLVKRFGPLYTGVFVPPAVAIGLLCVARRGGMSWHDLGLSRRTWLRGLAFALGAIVTVAIVYGLAVWWPITRSAFLDPRYQLDGKTALLTALVFIPLGTIMLEEVAFRGVLLGVLKKHRGRALAITLSSVLFGCWHILPSLSLGANELVSTVVGAGWWSRIALVAGVVVFTGLAGWLMCEIRQRSGSLLATVGLHWATNGMAVLITSAVWTWQLV